MASSSPFCGDSLTMSIHKFPAVHFFPLLLTYSPLLPAAPCIQEHGLRKLYALVDVHWTEAAAHIADIEALAEDPHFRGAHLAAAVASKVYFHLEAYPEALRLALAAGPHFEVFARDEYTETIVSHCIDTYTASRQKEVDEAGEDMREAIMASSAAAPTIGKEGAGGGGSLSRLFLTGRV